MVGANKNPEIIAAEKIDYYTNYYLAHTPEAGITNVPHYRKITYSNIYDNIDLVLHVKESGLKYEFIVRPKGKISNIKLKWNGAKPKHLQSGGIKYTSAFGELNESAPYTFTADGNEVKSRFILDKNVIGFDVAKYDESKVLVIDPELFWGTYFGGESNDFAYNICGDTEDNIYISGQTVSKTALASSGAFQEQVAGDYDAFISKFDSSGNLIWSTYMGGKLYDIGFGITSDLNNDIYITGETASKNGISTSGTHMQIIGGSNDAFIAKFDKDGHRKWGTYFGGVSEDQSYAIKTNSKGEIYIVGSTYSYYKIGTSDGHQEFPSYIGMNGFLAKFNNTGNIIWSTFYSGDNNVEMYNLDVNDEGDIFVAGHTNSTKNIATPQTYKPYHNTNFYYETFIVKFNNSGIRLWGTYFSGNRNTIIPQIYVDKYSNIYIACVSDSFKNNNNESYIVAGKFNTNGNLAWRTDFSGNKNDVCKGIYLNENERSLYITGYTSSNTGISTSNAYQTNYGGGQYDAFISKFNDNGAFTEGTYFGGENIDWSYGIRLGKRRSVYIIGNTTSTNNIATPNAFQPKLNSTNYDVFLARFSPITNDAGVSELVSPIGNQCAGMHEIFVKIKNFSRKAILDSTHIGFSINRDSPQSFKWIHGWHGIDPGDTCLAISIGKGNFKSGNNTIKIWTYNPNGSDDINYANDTLTQTLFFYETPEAKTGGNKEICIGDNITLGADAIPGNTYSWSSKPVSGLDPESKITVSPKLTTVYYLTETNTASGCQRTDSAIISVYPYPEPAIAGDTFICGQGEATFETALTPGNNYWWEFEGGEITSGQNTNRITVKINRTTKTSRLKVTEVNPAACKAEAGRQYIYTPSPILDLGPDDYLCEDYDELIKLDAGNGFITYRWQPTGDTTQFIIVRRVDNYFVVVADNCGNAQKDDVIIASNCPVKMYVPNAFTPTADGINDVFRPEIENVVDYRLIIYNRWGERIFFSTEIKYGWDGSFRARQAPKDVYFYMIQCTVKEGPNIRRLCNSGTVNLIR